MDKLNYYKLCFQRSEPSESTISCPVSTHGNVNDAIHSVMQHLDIPKEDFASLPIGGGAWRLTVNKLSESEYNQMVQQSNVDRSCYHAVLTGVPTD